MGREIRLSDDDIVAIENVLQQTLRKIGTKTKFAYEVVDQYWVTTKEKKQHFIVTKFKMSEDEEICYMLAITPEGGAPLGNLTRTVFLERPSPSPNLHRPLNREGGSRKVRGG